MKKEVEKRIFAHVIPHIPREAQEMIMDRLEDVFSATLPDVIIDILFIVLDNSVQLHTLEETICLLQKVIRAQEKHEQKDFFCDFVLYFFAKQQQVLSRRIAIHDL